MTDYNKGEYGQTIYVNMGEDVSTNTELSLILEPAIGTKKEISSGVTVGSANVDVNDETYLANEYLQYTIAADDLDYAGLWRKKGEATLSSTNKIISNYTHFSVLE